MTRAQERQLYRTRQCFDCLSVIPERAGVYHAALGCLLCQTCDAYTQSITRTFDHSPRGRFRPRAAVLALLRTRRPHAAHV